MDRMSGRTGAQRVAEMMAAVAVDRAIGDPVRPTHPVRLMGRVITAYERTVRPRLRGPGDQRAAGAALALGLPAVSYTHLRAHETDSYLVCRLLLEKKKMIKE